MKTRLDPRKLERELQRRNKTPEQLRQAIHMSPPTLTKLLKGDTVDHSTVDRIRKQLARWPIDQIVDELLATEATA